MPTKPCSDPPHYYLIDEKGDGTCIKCDAPHPKRKPATYWQHPGVEKVETRERPSVKPQGYFENNSTVLVFGYAKTPPGWD